jgi:serine/threonine protein kinase/tetratricopeptide (TPR) repeat protein
MTPLAPEKLGTCSVCGTARDTTSLSEIGCMVCMLQLAIESKPSSNGELPLVFGTYVIERYQDGDLWELGRGAMGVTYRATDTSLQRPVALKIVKADFAARGAEARKRFVREARAAASLRHPNVATAYHFGIDEDTGESFYAMELVEGETLEERVRRSGPMSVASVIDIALQITAALAAAEKRGLVHRDLKPANVMIACGEKEDDLTIKVIDFGLAKALADAPDARGLTHGGFVGTPAFASPEQLGSKPVDIRSDIYSLGATLWYLLTGHMPFGDRAGAAPPPVEQLKAARVPPRLISLLVSMLAMEPAARPSVSDLGQQLKAIRAQTTGSGKIIKRSALAAGILALATVVLVRSFHSSEVKPTSPALSAKSVAVLPFDHPAADATGRLFATGLQNDILVSLSKIADLKVIARSSVLQYRSANSDLRAIGRELGVDAVLEGTLRQDGNHARVSVQLIKVADGSQMWADNFDRELNDVFAIQSDLALQIASALEATVLPIEALGIRRRPTDDAQAYRLFVQANDLFAPADKLRPNLDKAEQLLQEAVKRDPKFALAFALLSHTETILADEYEATPARLAKARAWAEQALRLEPDLPEAHTAMGRYLWQGQGHIGERDLPGAAHEFETALRGLPGSAEIHTQLGRLQRQLGKWNEALANVEKAAALDPNTALRWDAVYATNLYMRRYREASKAIERSIALSPNSWRCEWLRALLARQWKGDLSELEHLRPPPAAERERLADPWFNTQMSLRRFDKAEGILRNDPREMIPESPGAPTPKSLFLGEVYAARKDERKAREYFEAALPVLERAVKESPLDAARHLALGQLYAGLHRKEDAIREGKRACQLLPESKDALDGVGMTEGMAWIYLRAGEPELALSLAEHCLSVPAGWHVGALRTSLYWEPIRNDPRFQQLLVKYAPRE